MVKNKLVKNKLDEYLEFDSNLLFNDTDYLVIFGGAIRDIIANKSEQINDIDILCMPNSMKKAIKILEDNGYITSELVQPNVYELYKNIRCIFFPITYYKNNKIVQFIRPTINSPQYGKNVLFETYFTLLKNVDLSSSGLFYDGEKIYESLENSYIHCLNSVFEDNKNTLMYNEERVSNRKYKLFNNGWRYYDENNILINRMLKIYKLKNIHIPSINDYIKEKFNSQFIPVIAMIEVDDINNDGFIGFL